MDHNIYLGGFFKYEELGDLGDLGDRKITIVTCLGNKGEKTLGFDYSHKRTLNKDVDGARTTTTTTTKQAFLEARMNNQHDPQQQQKQNTLSWMPG